MITSHSIRPFKGIVSDFMGRHRRYYWSDIKDCFNVQVLASIIFVFFANVTPAISFGGLLLTTTEQHLVSGGRRERRRWVGERGGGGKGWLVVVTASSVVIYYVNAYV